MCLLPQMSAKFRVDSPCMKLVLCWSRSPAESACWNLSSCFLQQSTQRDPLVWGWSYLYSRIYWSLPQCWQSISKYMNLSSLFQDRKWAAPAGDSLRWGGGTFWDLFFSVLSAWLSLFNHQVKNLPLFYRVISKVGPSEWWWLHHPQMLLCLLWESIMRSTILLIWKLWGK